MISLTSHSIQKSPNSSEQIDSKLKTAVLIPTFNRKDSLRNCLNCLKAQRFAKWQVQIIPIVIVDGSTDGTVEMLEKEFPQVHIVMGSGDWWYTKCINEGIKMGRLLNASFILTLNDDLDFRENLIETLISDHYLAGDLSIIGSVSLSMGKPRVITFSGVSKINYFLKETHHITKFSAIAENALNGVRPSLVLSGRGILYPVEVFDLLGLYDEKLVQYSSETDFTYSASRKGIPVFISYNARVFENVKMTSDGAVYNNPSFNKLIRSLANKHSINSFRKTCYYSVKHRGLLGGSVITLLRTLGVFKKFVQIKFRGGL
jgi:GT2 family glycosyltransferase